MIQYDIKRLLFLLMISSLFANTIPIEMKFGYIQSRSFALFTDSTGLLYHPIEFKNNSNKAIKYINVEINAYNRDGNQLYPWPGSTSCQITGPIQPGASLHATMSCSTYYDQWIDFTLVRILSVTYMDGTVDHTSTDYIKNTKNENQFIKDLVSWTIISIPILSLLGGILVHNF